MRSLVTIIVAGASSVASADVRPNSYPVVRTDRPIIVFPGMTELDLAIELPTYRTPDGSTTRLGDYVRGDFAARHAFGRVQIGAGGLITTLFDSYRAYADIQTGDVPGAIVVYVGYYRDAGVSYDVSERAGYVYKVLHVPEQLAIYASAQATMEELSTQYPAVPTTSGRILSASGTVTIEVQLLPMLALIENLSGYAPVKNSTTLSLSGAIGELTELEYSIPHWDFYVQFAVSDLTTKQRAFAAAGAVYRFGGP